MFIQRFTKLEVDSTITIFCLTINAKHYLCLPLTQYVLGIYTTRAKHQHIRKRWVVTDKSIVYCFFALAQKQSSKLKQRNKL